MAKPCAESKARVALDLTNHYVGNLTYFSENEWARALRSVSTGYDVPENLIETAIANYQYYRHTRNNLGPVHLL